MIANEVYDLIDALGTHSGRWPEAVREDVNRLIASDPALKAHFDAERRLDDQLSAWEEGEDGAGIEDEEGEDHREGEEEEDEDGDSDEEAADAEADDADIGVEAPDSDEKSDAKSAPSDGDGDEEDGEKDDPGDDGETVSDAIAEAFAEMGEIGDMDGAMSEIISKMAVGMFSKEKFVEFTRDYDLIEKIEIDPHVDVDKIEQRVQKVSATMQKDLQRIITARSQSVKTPGQRSGRVNVSSLHRLEINDDRVFFRRQVSNTKDVAVSLVVDASGSMKGSSFQLAVESAWAFSQVLDKLGIANEVIGFTTRCWTLPDGFAEAFRAFCKSIGKNSYQVRHEPLYMPIFKDFSERFGLEQKRRFATAHSSEWQCGHLNQNIDGASVLVAATRLLQRPEKRKLMIVFSDGAPCAGMDMGILDSHLKDVVKEIEKNGVETIGVGIEDANALKFYPKAFMVNKLAELPAKVMGELKKFLTK